MHCDIYNKSPRGKYVLVVSWLLVCYVSHAWAQEKVNTSKADSTGSEAADKYGSEPLRVPSITEILARARSGDAQSQYKIGMMYYSGNVVNKNYILASAWFLKAANQRYVDAQGQLGLMYWRGQGVEENIVYAYKWIGIAARNDNSWVYYREKIEKDLSPESINVVQGLVAQYDRQLSMSYSQKASGLAMQDKVAWGESAAVESPEQVASPTSSAGASQEPYFGETKQEWQDGCRQQGGVLKGSKLGFCVLNAGHTP